MFIFELKQAPSSKIHTCLFSDEIVKQVDHVLNNGLGATYVLMERFYPYIVKNHILGWENSDIERPVVLELGIFGAIIAWVHHIIFPVVFDPISEWPH